MTMYRIKPISPAPDTIELPKCMYNIKPLGAMNLESLSGKRVKMEPALQAIEDRQLEVITRLRKLRDQVDDMIKKAGGPNPNQNQGQGQQQRGGGGGKVKGNVVSSNSTGGGVALKNVTLPSELVIEANPSKPPLSLLFFLQVNPSLRILSHTHSTCDQQVDGKLQKLFSRDSTTANASGSTIRVVWKKLNDSRLTPPNLGSSSVEGESNLARYLSRVLCPSDSILNYDALPLEDLILVDEVLSSSSLVDSSPDNFLSSLQAYVQRKSGGGAGARTIADFVAYSTLRYLTQQQPKKSVQKNLVDWMNTLTNNVLC